MTSTLGKVCYLCSKLVAYFNTWNGPRAEYLSVSLIIIIKNHKYLHPVKEEILSYLDWCLKQQIKKQDLKHLSVLSAGSCLCASLIPTLPFIFFPSVSYVCIKEEFNYRSGLIEWVPCGRSRGMMSSNETYIWGPQLANGI